jgi:energy-coupling factor transport system ATP-binding protein
LATWLAMRVPLTSGALGTGGQDRLRDRSPRQHGPLRPAELAEAAVLADLAVGLHVLIWLLPVGGGLQAAAVTPLAALAARHRARALVVATAAGTGVSLLVGGGILAVQMVVLGAIALCVGAAIRRGYGLGRTVLFSLAGAGTFLVAVSLGYFYLFAGLRKLALQQIQLSWNGIARVVRLLGVPGQKLATAGSHAVSWGVAHWWIAIPVAELIAVASAAFLARLLAIPALERLLEAMGPPSRSAPPGVNPSEEVSPVPVRLVGASYRYPNRTRDALSGIDLTVAPGTFTVIVGANGSGKSTLARMLAGMAPTKGRVVRPGAAGLGLPGGTAMVFQRPESQVLGARVRDDLYWGLPRDVADRLELGVLLGRVGLGGMEDRETSTLSGGQLQRLAVASALARDPALLVADEATSMLDSSGRRDVTRLLRGLADDLGVAVVHVTHRLEEATSAHQVVELGDGTMVACGPPDEVLPQSTGGDIPQKRGHCAPPRARVPAASPGEALLELEGVGHVYARRSPWEQRALRDVNMTIAPGESVVVSGDNGSGKTTLAWVLSGLIEPTEGAARLGRRPVHHQVGSVGVAFQHARLQLFRPVVGADVAFGTDLDRAGVEAALNNVGLDGPSMAGRKVDELSGGEQRRVALAGLLARRPPVIVLDEPLAGLDEAARVGLVEVLEQLRCQHGVATVVVSHDADWAGRLGHRFVGLHEGRVGSDTGTGTSRSRAPLATPPAAGAGS